MVVPLEDAELRRVLVGDRVETVAHGRPLEHPPLAVLEEEPFGLVADEPRMQTADQHCVGAIARGGGRDAIVEPARARRRW